MSVRRPVPLLVIGGIVTAIVLGWGGYSAVSLMAYQSTYTDPASEEAFEAFQAQRTPT